jgi:hypothetical protein
MSSIFISYRRADSQLSCDRIYATLGAVFGAGQVYRDLNAIVGGADFRVAIARALKRCKVVLVVIGPQWLTVTGADGRRRLDDERDAVRLELEIALRQGMLLLPVLVQGTAVPRTEDLPASLRTLADQNMRHVRADPDFGRDMETVIQDIARVVPIPDRRSTWRLLRNTTQRLAGLALSALTLLLTLAALATWVHIPIVSELVRHWLGR